MLIWEPITKGTVIAKTKFFKYTITQCDDQPELFEWVADCTGTVIDSGGPDNLDECKQQCEADFNARIDRASRVIAAGKYVK